MNTSIDEIKSDLSIAIPDTSNISDVAYSVSYPMKPPAESIAKRKLLDTRKNIIMYPNDVPKYFMLMEISEYSRKSMFSIGRNNSISSIVLPLPSNLKNYTQVSYTEKKVGALPGNALNTIGGITSGENIKENGDRAAGVIGALGVAALQKVHGNGIIDSAVDAAKVAGYTPNYFLTVLLEGPAYKKHTYNWTFSPRNADESRTLQQIITMLQNYQAPDITAGGALFTFPKIFWLQFLPNAGKLFKFKPAVLESISVDYSAGGEPAFRVSEYPTAISIQMQFHELEFWLNGDFNMNDDPTDISINKSGR